MDKAYIIDVDKSRMNFCKMFVFNGKDYCLKNLARINIFTPDNINILLWKLIMIMVIISQIYSIVLTVSFKVTIDSSIEFLFLITIPLILGIFDIILNFNIAFYAEVKEL
jgi:hypothetical protein